MKTYSIIPAAGKSTRMGQNKLLLPWPCLPSKMVADSAEISDFAENQERTVLEAVLAAWSASQVAATVVVLRQEAAQSQCRSGETDRVRELCESFQLEICLVDNPPDMKASVVAGMDYLISKVSPEETDACFVSPADLPTISTSLIDRLIQAANDSEKSIVAPCLASRRGHPTLFRWTRLQQVRGLGADQGVNALVNANQVEEIDVPKTEFVVDIDSPDDYQRLLRKHSGT